MINHERVPFSYLHAVKKFAVIISLSFVFLLYGLYFHSYGNQLLAAPSHVSFAAPPSFSNNDPSGFLLAVNLTDSVGSFSAKKSSNYFSAFSAIPGRLYCTMFSTCRMNANQYSLYPGHACIIFPFHSFW